MTGLNKRTAGKYPKDHANLLENMLQLYCAMEDSLYIFHIADL